MGRLTQDPQREIIDDFANEIADKKRTTNPIEKITVDFRNNIAEKIESTIYHVPLELLLYRRENGRISSSVKSYERLEGPINSLDSSDQTRLANLLFEKDPEKTAELVQLLYADGQRDPGIITVDGFLVNGNRRRAALEQLRKEHPNEDRFRSMKVVILPGMGDEGGPPTIKEIEQIENRYQLQADGRAEYYAFDAALSIRDKELSGYTLEEQMRDDPLYKMMPKREFQRALAKRKKELLDPLACVDEYLEAIGRPGEYSAVSKGIGDPRGRWQAFLDLSTSFVGHVSTASKRAALSVSEEEAGQILQSAYAIIRMKDIPSFGKLHVIMRDLKKYTQHGKEHLLKIATDVKHKLPKEETTDQKGDGLPTEAIDSKWVNKYKTEITRNLVKARDAHEGGSEKDAPIVLLEDALKKLNHDNMIVGNIDVSDLPRALRLANDLNKRIEELKGQIYRRQQHASDYGLTG